MEGKEVTDNNVIVTLQYGDLDTAIQWCNTSCSPGWELRNILSPAGQSNGVYQFHFVDSRDTTMFIMRFA